MKISPIFQPRDLWIGAYWDDKRRWLYLLPIPCLGIVLKFSDAYDDAHNQMRVDAARYRWLRSRIEPAHQWPHIAQWPSDGTEGIPQIFTPMGYDSSALDRAVDLGIAKTMPAYICRRCGRTTPVDYCPRGPCPMELLPAKD